ncbi:hypothetical protein C8R48DRAFT_702104 [Suillus tomentosus]|nr:hypothetical protein C8R48DRAFT_702104 [Suillus tomentosus]
MLSNALAGVDFLSDILQFKANCFLFLLWCRASVQSQSHGGTTSSLFNIYFERSAIAPSCGCPHSRNDGIT